MNQVYLLLHVCWKDAFVFYGCRQHNLWSEKNGLEKINYSGVVSIESFTPEIKELAGAVCIWKNLAKSQDGFASEGITFLKKLLKP